MGEHGFEGVGFFGGAVGDECLAGFYVGASDDFGEHFGIGLVFGEDGFDLVVADDLKKGSGNFMTENHEVIQQLMEYVFTLPRSWQRLGSFAADGFDDCLGDFVEPAPCQGANHSPDEAVVGGEQFPGSRIAGFGEAAAA